jgi:hypothetical protein
MSCQRLSHTGRVLDVYRMVSQRLGRVCRRGYDFGDGRKWAYRTSGVTSAIAASPSICADAVSAIGVAVHSVVGGQRS